MPRKRSQRSRRRLAPALITDPVQCAKAAGLRYVSDDIPGIRRKRAGKGFVYLDPDGNRIKDSAELQRLQSLAIPPAYKDVWICPIANGHLQATARDAKGRKQYRYHQLWRQIRNETKFTRMIAFGDALPLIRERVDQDLGLRGLPCEKVLATVVRLLETTYIRVGNETYVRENRSFGLTTMRCRHVDVSGTTLRFKFRGKSGVKHDIQLRDRRLARVIKYCQDIPGYELFQYLDDQGNPQSIDAGAVNAYLHDLTQQDFTAKDFRTWAGTVLAALEFQAIGPFTTQTQAKKNISQAIKNVAAKLGNRPATSRKYYVHPAIVEAYLEGTLLPALEVAAQQSKPNSAYALRPEEMAVVQVLEKRWHAEQPVAS